MKASPKTKKALAMLVGVVFWLVVWQVASLLIAERLFLPSPLDVVRVLGQLAVTGQFWAACGTSLLRIAGGFVLGLVLGALLAVLSAAFRVAEILISPMMQLVRATPVASFIILALVWVNVRYLSTFVSLLIVLPVIYSTVRSGIAAADGQLLEMADVFHVRFWRRVRFIYLPALLPPLMGAAELAVGMCWKSGVAAEVIGLPAGTIGERLYQAKIFLQTPDLFAWTVVIILLSWGFGRLVLFLMRFASRALEGGAAR